MKCGHCQTYGVSVSHVRDCSQGRTIQAAVQSVVHKHVNPTPITVEPIEEVPAEVLERNAPATEAGIYKSGDAYYKVQVAVHGSGRPYAKRLVMEEPDCGGCANGEPCGAGCRWTATWEYAPGAIKSLRAGDRLTAEEAQEFGSIYGICVFCSKPLTDERSIFAGYGEKCASNHGLPWGAVA